VEARIVPHHYLCYARPRTGHERVRELAAWTAADAIAQAEILLRDYEPRLTLFKVVPVPIGQEDQLLEWTW
jgi:hypothetical protein